MALVAGVWGALTGLLLPRAAYRFSVPPGEPWRDRCPAGAHPLRGWLGGARCAACGSARGRAEPKGGAEAGEARSGAVAREGRSGPDGGEGRSGSAGGEGRSGPDGGEGRSGSAGGEGRSGPDGGEGRSGSAGGEAHSGPVGRAAGSASAGRQVPSGLPLALVTALVCAVLAAATGTRPELGVWLLLAPVGVLLAAVDLRVRRLPDPLTLPLAAAALALLGVTALLPEHTGHWPTALCAALALTAGLFALHLLNPDGMGFGDVKLAAGTGAVLGWYGWPTVLLGTFAAFLLGALYGGALVLARRAGRKTGVPFGPFLLAGTLAGLLTGAFAA
ncbi:prepilin peptidase [Streptomyces rubradiris]|uniref:prepilin peptidase n=1 Tax=Streptomyces rubradiris TaxID=285531 RepID=UPI00167A739E|nr:prepilin peptidase [Streptomyces rubradiris]